MRLLCVVFLHSADKFAPPVICMPTECKKSNEYELEGDDPGVDTVGEPDGVVKVTEEFVLSPDGCGDAICTDRLANSSILLISLGDDDEGDVTVSVTTLLGDLTKPLVFSAAIVVSTLESTILVVVAVAETVFVANAVLIAVGSSAGCIFL